MVFFFLFYSTFFLSFINYLIIETKTKMMRNEINKNSRQMETNEIAALTVATDKCSDVSTKEHCASCPLPPLSRISLDFRSFSFVSNKKYMIYMYDGCLANKNHNDIL